MGSEIKITEQLGLAVGTATHRLRKIILFELVKKCGLDKCFQCGESITNIEELSIEHKIPYLDSAEPEKLFFDIDNIAFSHLRCNIQAARRIESVCGTLNSYRNGCKCLQCRAAKANEMKRWRGKKKNGSDAQRG